MASELARAKAQLASQRRKGEEVEASLVRKAVIGGTAALTAFAENKGLEVEYFGVPTKVGLALLFSLGEAVSRDKTVRRLAGAMADAEIGAYSYASVKGGTFIAGEGGNF